MTVMAFRIPNQIEQTVKVTEVSCGKNSRNVESSKFRFSMTTP